MNQENKENSKSKTGPEPETVKIDKNWEEAVDDALKKKRPKEGWPEPNQDQEKQ